MTMSRHDSRARWPALLLACVLLTAGFGVAPSAQASGTYVGRPAGPPGPLESARYHLGKKIFKGKVDLSAAQVDATKLEQRTADLKACQAKLPARTKAKVDLPALASVGVEVVVEDDAAWAAGLPNAGHQRIRLVGAPASVVTRALDGRPDVAVFDHPVVESGRVERLPYVLEQAVSITAHRFGTPDHLTDDVLVTG